MKTNQQHLSSQVTYAPVKMFRRIYSTLLAFSFVGATALQGQLIIFSTDFESATQTANNDPVAHGGTVASGYTASTFTPGPGIGTFRLDTHVDSPSKNFISEVAGTNPASTMAEAVTAEAYFQFTITAPAAIDFTELKFGMRGIGSTNTGYVTVRSNVDNYTADLGTASGPMSSAASSVIATVDLSSISGFTDLTTVTFRFFVYDEYSGQNNRRIGVDDIQVSVIPEPAAFALIGGLLALGIVIIRRRIR
jgi:hypothetical protein